MTRSTYLALAACTRFRRSQEDSSRGRNSFPRASSARSSVLMCCPNRCLICRGNIMILYTYIHCSVSSVVIRGQISWDEFIITNLLLFTITHDRDDTVERVDLIFVTVITRQRICVSFLWHLLSKSFASSRIFSVHEIYLFSIVLKILNNIGDIDDHRDSQRVK